MRFSTRVADARTEMPERKKVAEPARDVRVGDGDAALLEMLEAQMREAAAELLDFEEAAPLRDQDVRAQGAHARRRRRRSRRRAVGRLRARPRA